jgi:hypothetical protein
MEGDSDRQSLLVDLEPAVMAEVPRPDLLVADAEPYKASWDTSFTVKG